ncbi:MAG: hypothetical protein Tp1100DCM1099271_44 [Prokaryotic dsDNA virus sp.]|nr:MAG: hypothetical protein Tp1102SUR405181_28 [Prokaryotic dsDNA virus sp.]QDP60072.1 MAG: hypothetical protein Tp1100DCM1099271_44 [Prokaryotic dsDNA virus sp.]QDP67093.1 MAG: hypothetical protein Tp1111SUR49671_13 [Prokaryotic dsDNA virus sp.]|tara:strand:+ start:21924 stop:24386 length:2463 start_codon:yes stop_codon:yes gene_type:complete
MARVHPFQSNFTAGELSPKLAGQIDFKKYANGVETLENMTVFPQGGAARRYGTRYIGPVKDHTKTTRLIPFEFNDEQTYILEFGHQYIRFYKDEGIITESNKTISGITQANPAVVTATSHGYTNGDEVIITGVVGMTEVNGKRFKVANKTTNTFELQTLAGVNINSTSHTAYGSAGVANKIYEITTTITESILYEIQHTQSADIMYIVHETLAPQKLTRTGHTSWSITNEVLENGPYLDANTTSTTLNPASTAIATGVALVASADLFAATDVGRLVKLHSGHAKITAFTDAQNVTIEILATLSASTATTDWQLGTFVSTLGFPRTVTFFEQRLVFAGTTSFPQTIFASQSGLYTNFDVGTSAAADAFIYTIAANKVNVIRWLAPARDLIVGTAGGEFRVGKPVGEPLKPDNVNITLQTTYGGNTTEAVQIGNVILFVQKQRKKIREFAYRFDDDAYSAPDMTILAEHVTGTGVYDIAWAQEPESIYWAVRDDGILLGMTYKREEDIIAWHRHILGGFVKHSFNAGTAITASGSDTLKNGKITISSHGYTTGDAVVYDANGNTAITGLDDGRTYYVYVIDANTINLARTYQQAIDRTVQQLTAVGSGTHIFKNHAKVKSIASVSSDTENEVYVIVERIIDGSRVQYVEYLDSTLNMDSSLSGLINGADGTLTNLDHLEGESVQILVGDAVYPNQTVSNGQISVTLPSTSGQHLVEVGLGYTSKLVTMKIEAGANAGTAQNRPKRFNEIAVRLHETVGVTINGDQIPFRSSSTPVGQNIPEFTGDKKVTNLGWDTDGQVTIEQTQPLPMTVLGITGTLVTSD